MGERCELATPENSDDESGDAFTDGDFGDSEEETAVERSSIKTTHMPVNESVNTEIQVNSSVDCIDNCVDQSNSVYEEFDDSNGNMQHSDFTYGDNSSADLRRDSQSDNGSIVGILGDQHNHVCKLVSFKMLVFVIPLFMLPHDILSIVFLYYFSSPSELHSTSL